MTNRPREPRAGGGAPAPRRAPPAGFRLDRRRFLKSSASALGAYAVAIGGASWIIGADKAWAVEYDVLEPEVAQSLLVMARDLYPHDFLGDVYYAKVVKDLDVEASGFEDKSRLDMLRDGVNRLNEEVGAEYATADEATRVQALEAISDTPFFQAVRGKAVVSLYNQAPVWSQFGYEGPSFEIGGYLWNGFDDLDWLPNPPEAASPPPQI